MSPEQIHIQNPDEAALQNAFRSLPEIGEINLSTDINALKSTISIMESTGFVAIEVLYINSSSELVNIRAYKGKNGPCYNTGRKALYRGAAMAALDDDMHLLFNNKEIDICEKTAAIFQLPPYLKLLKCSDPDPLLLKQLVTAPEIFNCNSFDDDSEVLYGLVLNAQKEEESVDLFYPGPFKMLIMTDGRIVKRGEVNRVAKSYSRHLTGKDGLFKLDNNKAVKPIFFQDLYKSQGSRCLLDYHLVPEVTDSVNKIEREADITILKKTSQELREHLIKLITRDKKYFLLTGSDIGDKLGCCPSEIVTEANQLRKAGILASYNQPVAEQACPVTIYAFRDEIRHIDNELSFSINNDLRNRVLKELHTKSAAKFNILARWVLLTFIILTLTIALIRQFNISSGAGSDLFKQLSPLSESQYMILLFHNTERCSQCLRMEKYTRELLDKDFNDKVKADIVEFKLVPMDTPINLNLVERFGIYTSTIVFIRFDNKEEGKIKVLNDSWESSDNEIKFKEMLRSEFIKFLNDNE